MVSQIPKESVEYCGYYQSPVGVIEIISSETSIISISFLRNDKSKPENKNDILDYCIVELDKYFKGELTEFSSRLSLGGTIFQQKVWKELMKIPFGQTISYLDLAKRTGDIKAVRAVGLANGKNKIPIIIPCHRVIGSNGNLIGYSGGLWIKEWLLNHERKFSSNQETGNQLNLF
ncbi:MAG: methylated-DNA--[protein]-cysteine S-methyltransferase [Ignavibacteriales bacterium]|nr:methylated-DNA--[protein]-cysteine S-methyltransferase [Ignavibacteriales bacterium]